MIKLSDFVGTILTDLASARANADYTAAAASEMYHADPFIKNLPIPHYVIDEVEVDVPVTVLGLSTQSEEYIGKKQMLIESLKANLQPVLLESFKWNYINERVKVSTENASDLTDKKGKTFNPKEFEFSELMLKSFDDCIKEISKTVVAKFKNNLELYNYAVLKILELTESFSTELKYALKAEVKHFFGKTKEQNDHLNPFLTSDSINNAIKYVSNIMFFNFKKIVQSDSGVLIDIKTNTMNVYGQKDCFMHIKLKIREQDLNLLTEETEKKEKRYLSLT